MKTCGGFARPKENGRLAAPVLLSRKPALRIHKAIPGKH